MALRALRAVPIYSEFKFEIHCRSLYDMHFLYNVKFSTLKTVRTRLLEDAIKQQIVFLPQNIFKRIKLREIELQTLYDLIKMLL